MSSILITGNHGFIGCWLNLYLKELISSDLLGIDNRSSYGERLIDFKEESLNIVKKQYDEELSDINKLTVIINNNDVSEIFHIAGQAIVPRAFEDPSLTFDSNVISSFNILEATRRCDSVKKVCLITSDKVYKNENKNIHFKEDDKLGGKDIYSTSKVICENLAESYRNIHLNSSKIVEVIRLGNVVGGGDYSVNRLLPDLMRSFLKKRIFEVRYPNATRPFQHVLDVCHGIYSILLNNPLHENQNYAGEAWNLGPKNNTSLIVGDVIKKFTEVFNIEDIQPRKNKLPEDILLAVDNTKYKNVFGNPIYDSEAAVLKAIEWYKNIHSYNLAPWEISLKDIRDFINTNKLK